MTKKSIRARVVRDESGWIARLEVDDEGWARCPPPVGARVIVETTDGDVAAGEVFEEGGRRFVRVSCELRGSVYVRRAPENKERR